MKNLKIKFGSKILTYTRVTFLYTLGYANVTNMLQNPNSKVLKNVKIL